MAKKKKIRKDYGKERKLWNNWKMTKRSTWDKEWEHKKTGIILNLSSEGAGPFADEATWELMVKYPNGEGSRIDYEFGGSGDYISPEDRIARNTLMKKVKMFMKKSNDFTTMKQIKQLKKQFKKS